MIKDYGLYFKKCPASSYEDTKVGITELVNARTRLGTYQNAIGRAWEESFKYFWIGDENQIRIAETQVKRHFKDKISSAEAGLSEWICDVSEQELLEFITFLREKHYIKFIDAPAQFLPLTMPLCEDLAQWYEENRPLED